MVRRGARLAPTAPGPAVRLSANNFPIPALRAFPPMDSLGSAADSSRFNVAGGAARVLLSG